MRHNPKLVRRAQTLRKNMTKEERHLWYDFLKLHPVQFKRQYPIGPYILDFYCPKLRLTIELDGSQHYEVSQAEYDRRRTVFLEEQGLRVLRFSNLDVMRNFRGVCDAIDLAIQASIG